MTWACISYKVKTFLLPFSLSFSYKCPQTTYIVSGSETKNTQTLAEKDKQLMKGAAEAERKWVHWVWEEILLWLWMIEWYQRDIIAPDSKSLCDHYETTQGDESVFHLPQKVGGEKNNKTEGDKERETKTSDEGARSDQEGIRSWLLLMRKRRNQVGGKKWIVTCCSPPFLPYLLPLPSMLPSFPFLFKSIPALLHLLSYIFNIRWSVVIKQQITSSALPPTPLPPLLHWLTSPFPSPPSSGVPSSSPTHFLSSTLLVRHLFLWLAASFLHPALAHLPRLLGFRLAAWPLRSPDQILLLDQLCNSRWGEVQVKKDETVEKGDDRESEEGIKTNKLRKFEKTQNYFESQMSISKQIEKQWIFDTLKLHFFLPVAVIINFYPPNKTPATVVYG